MNYDKKNDQYPGAYGAFEVFAIQAITEQGEKVEELEYRIRRCESLLGSKG